MKILLALIALFWVPLTESPKTEYKLAENSKISVSGTSTLHDWVMDSKRVKGEASIEVSDNQIMDIRSIKVVVPVESLKSGKSGMDNNAYDALKSKKYPNIVFTLTGFDKISQSNGSSKVEVTGNLTIAGKTRQEKILVAYQTDAKGNLKCKGAKQIRMTDYGVTPPEVMFGTVKTGNEITIGFDLDLLVDGGYAQN